MLDKKEVDTMIDAMTRERHQLGTVLCQQGEPATKFYVIMNGTVGAYMQIGNDSGKKRKVGTIPTYGFFGENALLSEPGVEVVRNATVEVESESISLLVLTKATFHELLDDGKLDRKVLDGVKQVDLERQEQNSLNL